MTAGLFPIVLACARFAQAAPPAIELRSPSSAMLGKAVDIEASAKLAPGESLSLDLERSTTDTFALTAVQELPGASPKKFRLSLLPLDLGKKSFPLFWSFVSAGSTRTLSSMVTLDVSAPPEAAKAQDVKDIKPPARARPALWPWLLLFAILLGIWYWLQRRAKRPLDSSAAQALGRDRRPPEVIAEEELARLEAAGLWERGLRKEFYMDLSDILRRYLERRYGFAATRETSAEIFRRLRRLELPGRLVADFKNLFEKADLVKFAKLAAENPWLGLDLAAARTFVHETTPRPSPAEAKP